MSVEKCGNRKCFFCGKTNKAKSKVVEWVEHNSYIENPNAEGKIVLVLCPKCAIMLGERLIGDGFMADPKATDPETLSMLIESRMRYAKVIK